MQRPPATHHLTWREWAVLPHETGLHELIDGEHQVSPSPPAPHRWTSMLLASRLFEHVQARGLGVVLTAPMGVVLSERDVLEPDILFVSRGRLDIVKDWVFGAPDLVVEVLSRTTRRRDRGAKRQLHETAGVEEYWLVDVDWRTIEVLRRRGERLSEAGSYSAEAGEVLTTPLLPELEISLSDVFAAPPWQTD